MDKKKCTAIVLAAGKGTRMGTKIHKQYLEICGRPVLYYALNAFERSEIIDNIILVTGAEEIDYCKSEIVDKYNLTKVSNIVCGGKERYNSVYNGLKCVDHDGYVFIHDGARPFVDRESITRAYNIVKEENACIVAMPVKDTIKISDTTKHVVSTPDRRTVWMVQTPQVFSSKLIKEAYEKMMDTDCSGVTDDAMVVEQMTGHLIRLVEGSYMNIKITTPEDLEIGEVFIKRMMK